MKFKKFLILITLIGFISINVAFAGFFGHDDGECDLFYIDVPEGFHNAGELDYNESLFLATKSYERPYHSLHVNQIGISYVDKFIDFDKEGIEIVDSVDEGNFKVYKTYDESNSKWRYITYAYYSDGHYEYQLELAHEGCLYDDTQFKKDVDLLKGVAHSIKRK